jgi:hypothetical protein
MKFTHQVKIGGVEITIEDTAESNAELWQKIAFWHSLPQVAPKGATDLRFEYRTPKDKSGNPVEYYSIVCPSERQEFKLGQKRKNAGQLFPKQWHTWVPGHQTDDDEEEPVQPKPLTASTPNSNPAKKPDSGNILPLTSRPLTDAELQKRAEQFVGEGRVSYGNSQYTVQVNDRIAYTITKGADDKPVCKCDRHQTGIQTNPNFTCEHVRAVKLFVKTDKPDSRSELKLLIADLQSAGMADEAIDAAIARVCEGQFAVEELSPAEVSKAIRSLQGKLNDLHLKARTEAA